MAEDRAGGYGEYGFTAEYYDHVTSYRERSDIPFWVEMAQASGGPVLEIGCGTGRVLIPIARAGIDITGIDLSPFTGRLPAQPGRRAGRGAVARPARRRRYAGI